MVELRKYQHDAVHSLRELFGQGMKRLVLYLPTGGGKTLTALHMVKGAVAKGRRVMFVCNRKHLVDQASRVFDAAGVDHGIVQAENTRGLDRKVIIASVQSLKTRGIPLDIGLIVFDEAHFVAGSALAKSIIFKHSLVPIIGLSATPFAKGMAKRYDEIKGPLFQAMSAATSIRELIELGYLVDVDIYAPSEPDMTKYRITKTAYGEDYSDKDAAEASDTPKLVGDIVKHWIKLAHGTPTVVFASSVLHSRHIVESFQKAGVSAAHIDAYTSDEDRRSIFESYLLGDIAVLSNVGVLCEGWDAPMCQTMILARPTRSLIRYIQMAGRILRPHENKKLGLILDHSGTVARLGFPTDDLPLELDDGKPQKSEAADAKEKEEGLPKACPECSFMKPPKTPKCPQCGFVQTYSKPVEVADGELVAVKGKRKSQFGDKQETYSGLLGYAMQRGYSEGWVAHKYREIFGVWPRSLKHHPKQPSDALWSWCKSQQIRYAHRRQDATREPGKPSAF